MKKNNSAVAFNLLYFDEKDKEDHLIIPANVSECNSEQKSYAILFMISDVPKCHINFF